MNSKVIIKSFQNGISVILDEETEFESLIDEVGLKFKESASFFGKAKMAVSFEGRTLTEEQEKRLITVIRQNCALNIICMIGKDEEKNQTYLRAIEQVKKKDENMGQFYRGNLKNGQILEMESSVVVIGDVYPGSAIIAKKDIVIIGGLYGEAYAGADGVPGHFVAALEMLPEKLKIGNRRANLSKKQSKWPIKLKSQPKIAYEKEDSIVVEQITKDILGMLQD